MFILEILQELVPFIAEQSLGVDVEVVDGNVQLSCSRSTFASATDFFFSFFIEKVKVWIQYVQ